MIERPIDVAIAGGGPVACALAAALADSAVSFVRIAPDASAADRPIALSHASRLLCERLRVWDDIRSTPIHTIHVSQRGGFGRTLMRSSELGLPALGYVAPYSTVLAPLSAAAPALRASLQDWKVDADCVTLRVRGEAGEQGLRARLLVLADGGSGAPAERVKDYGQQALVAETSAERRHANTAWERFTSEGPIALLPFGERLALIWTARPETVQRLLGMPDALFLRELREAFGGRLGAFREVTARAAFPVALRYRDAGAGPRALVVGNAAQTLHPVAGQGLNLGLRDAWELAEQLREGTQDIGSPQFIARYIRRRRADRRAGIVVTDSLARFFADSSPLLARARGAGLAALDLLPPARRFFARRMMYGTRALP
jgi:2-octaprenyl-6-methoxyphenol hydroxylase